MKHIFTAIFICFITLPVIADSISHRKSTEELLLVFNIDATMKSMATNIKEMQSTQLKALDVPVNSQPIIDEHIEKTIELVFSALSWENVKEQYIDAYVSVYNEKEINDLLTFFTSDSGEKYIEKLPELNSLVMKIAGEKVLYLQPQMKTLSEELKMKLGSSASE